VLVISNSPALIVVIKGGQLGFREVHTSHGTAALLQKRKKPPAALLVSVTL
jgi:hypothetical protein